MSQILQRIKKAYHLEKDAEVANFLDIKPSTLSMQKNRGRLNLERIIERCSELNKNWLLDGTGQMWEPEKSGRCKIPIFSSIAVAENHEVDFEESQKSGDIFTDIGQNGLDLPMTDDVIGYAVSVDSSLQQVKKNDIVLVDVSKKKPRDEVSYLLSTDHQLFCGRIKKQSGKYIIHEENRSSSGSNGDFSIIGEVVCIIRKCDF